MCYSLTRLLSCCTSAAAFLSGMGEPLHNMSALLPALDIICHPQGLGLSRAKVIVSTVGLVPQLRQLRASGKAKLAGGQRRVTGLGSTHSEATNLTQSKEAKCT